MAAVIAVLIGGLGLAATLAVAGSVLLHRLYRRYRTEIERDREWDEAHMPAGMPVSKEDPDA